MADNTEKLLKEIAKSTKIQSDAMLKIARGTSHDISIGRTAESRGKETRGGSHQSSDGFMSRIIGDEKQGKKQQREIMNELKKPSSTFNKLLASFMDTLLGRMIFIAKSNIEHYYQRLEGAISGLTNRIFGQMLDDIRPFTEAVRATAQFLFRMLKPLKEMLFSIVKFPIGMFKGIFEGMNKVSTFLQNKLSLLIPKKEVKSPEVKELKKQTSMSSKLLRTQGKIIRWLTYIEKNTAASASATGARGGIGAYKSARTARWIRNWGRNMVPPSDGKGGGLTSTAGKVAGGVIGGVGSIFGGVGSLLSGGLGIFGSLIPMLLKGVLAVAGVSLLIGLWKRFEETATGKKVKAWVTDLWDTTLLPFWRNTMRPELEDFWNDFLWPAMKKGAGELGSLMWKGFKTAATTAAESALPTENVIPKTDDERVNTLIKKGGLTTQNIKTLLASNRVEEERKRKIIDWKQMAKTLGWIAGGVATATVAAATAPVSIPAGVVALTGAGLGALASHVNRKEGGAVPIMAHEGEYVIQKKAVDKYGLGMMNAINNGLLQHFNLGGQVEQWRPLVSRYWSDRNDIETALHIIQAESTGIPQKGKKSNDYGLFQINKIHGPDLINAGILNEGENVSALTYDNERNAKAARWLYDHKGGWQPWFMSYHNWGRSLGFTPAKFDVAKAAIDRAKHGATGTMSFGLGTPKTAIASAGTGFGGGVMGGLFDFASNLFDKVGNLTVGELFGASPTSTMSVAAAEAAATKGITEGFPNTAEISGGGTGSGTVNIVAGSGSSDVANAGMPASPIYDNAFYQLNVGRILALNNSIAG